MKRLSLLISVFVIALMAFAAVASAQQASVFGDGVLIRGYIECTGGCGLTETPSYSAYLEVRDETGNILLLPDFIVAGDLGTATPIVAENPFRIHNNDLVNNNITLSFDSLTNRVYVFCTDLDGLHVMTYKISLNTPVSGVCGSANTQAYYTAPASNLCSVGNASTVSGSGSTWTWMCSGNGIVGATNANCSAYKKVDGTCGPSNGLTVSSAPTTDLCSAGTTTSVIGSGPWNWTCIGLYGGSTSPTCSANSSQTGKGVDLAITYVSAPTAVNPGAILPITATVVNRSSNAAGAFSVKFYLGSEATGTLLSTATVSGLAGGASTSASASPRVYLTAHVWTYITVVVVPNALDTDTVPSNNSYVRYVQGN